MRYTIVIPAWNEAAYIEATLASVQQAMAVVKEHAGFAGELVVVDNNSSDDTGERARAAGARVVFEPINRIASARNAGAAASRSDALVFIDADTSVSGPLLLTALERLASGEVVGGGARIAPDRPVEGFARHGLEFWNAFGRWRQLAAGCFIYCRRDAFDAIGGFSRQVYAGEEIFLSRELKRWARRRGMRFELIDEPPVVTSVRKLDWYSPLQLVRQAALVLLPGALYSKTLCGTWYDRRGERR